MPGLSHHFERMGGGVPGVRDAARPASGVRAAFDGIRLFARSPYLILIGLFLAGQTMAGTFLYVESRAFTGEVFPTWDVPAEVAAANRTARGEFFAQVDVAYNAIALFVQLFLVGRLVRWVGLGVMLVARGPQSFTDGQRALVNLQGQLIGISIMARAIPAISSQTMAP